MSDTFAAMMLEEGKSKPQAGIQQISFADLPDHDVLVEVAYSSLNYKDGLAVSGRGRISRRLPMVAGIDLAGTVVESGSPDWQTGDKVVVNGWGLSETEWGGYARYQRVKPEWLIRLPEAFTLKEAMAIGTAGYTGCAVRQYAGALGLNARHGRGGRYRGSRRRRLHSDQPAVGQGLRYRRLDGARRGSARVSGNAGRARLHRSLRIVLCRQAAAEGALERRRRHGGFRYARQRDRADNLWRCSRRLRAGGRA